MGSVIICCSDSSLFQWQGAQEGSPPPLHGWRLQEEREERLLFQTDSPAFFKTHDWLRVGGSSKPHYLFSVMYNTHRRLCKCGLWCKGNSFCFFPFPEDNRLVLACAQADAGRLVICLFNLWVKSWPDRYFKLTPLTLASIKLECSQCFLLLLLLLVFHLHTLF